ncbi:HmuY family protein [Paraflavitalea sp. CAU 1676]|uniref:HmuY family protein n=1 Tax=Paraflavitalea sp. CAU 1676 TaxID=3032598 RepID=UPI0023DA1D74|nr:HmuY family protein [Paraflavitalea sp. CAU 1676]MDF2187149.1 HmuY family protein [Paraflavitalea sp. CAU 1676]
MSTTSKMAPWFLCAGIAIAVTSCDKDDNVYIPPPSDGKSTTLNGGTGGSNAAHSVFLDLSTDLQDSVKRVSWDLGFYTGSDFRVVINNTTAATAKAINKTDLSQVNAADTAGFADALALGQGAGTFSIIDDVEGDLSKTVIAAVSATESDNKVYILKPSNGMVAAARDWYKIRIIRNGANYKLQYARLSETSVKTIDITKDASYNFKYISLETNGAVNVEPANANWDIEWTLTTYKANATTPYPYSDYVYINHLAGVTAAEVLTTTATFEAYAEANIASTTFVSNKVVIGGNWRNTQPPAPVGVKTDRFYVVKDAAGNVYKLRFLSFHASDGGLRGYPKVEYKLVKKA